MSILGLRLQQKFRDLYHLKTHMKQAQKPVFFRSSVSGCFGYPSHSFHVGKFSFQAGLMIVRKPIEMGPDHVDKSKRDKCFASRDEYWKCLDNNNDNEEACKQLRQVLESTCPSLWVAHYDRRRKYLKFQELSGREDFDVLQYFNQQEKQEKEKAKARNPPKSS